MITHNGKYYLYRHIRHDKNIPFYIGVGQKENNGHKRITTEYRRAFVHFTRNKYWKSVVKNTTYSVEILLESDERDFISKKEIEFIALYGRKDIGSGYLCNMTDGGDYYNKPDIKYPNQGRNKLTTQQRQSITRNAKKHEFGSNPVNVFVYNKTTGEFIKEYPQIKMAAKELRLSKGKVSMSLSERCSYKSYIFSPVFVGEKINVTSFVIKRDFKKPVIKLDGNNFSIIERYSSGQEAATKTGCSPSNILISIKNGIRCSGYYWKYDDGLPFVNKNKRNR